MAMTDASRRTVGRRTVVRGAVVTAWTVPVVQAVASAPALAASGPASLGTSSATGAVRNGLYVVTVTVVNTGNSPTVNLTANLSWTSTDGALKKTSAGSGWTALSHGSAPVSWTANAQLAAINGSTTLVLTLTPPTPSGKDKTLHGGQALVTLSTDGGTGKSLTVNF
jgi:hypothetical protein